jgi:hypothetical protein
MASNDRCSQQRPLLHGATAAVAALVLTAGLLVAACSGPSAPVAVETAYPALDQLPTSALPQEPYPEPGPADSGVEPAADRAGALAALADVAAVDIVEDWSVFGTAEEVEAVITRNLGMGENVMLLTLEPADSAALPSGSALAVTYDIGEEDPHDFVGFNRDRLDQLAPASWAGATGVGLWLEPHGTVDVHVVFQFREASGEVWRAEVPVPAAGGGSPLVLPLDEETFRWAPWSTTENGRIDLDAIDQYGLYVGHRGPDQAGVVRFGPLVLLRP